MYNQEEIQALIEAYLGNEISEKEKAAFEEKLKTDSKFGDTVNLYLQAKEVLMQEGKTELRKMLDEELASSNKKGGPAFLKYRFAVAAAVLLLISISALYYFLSPPPTPIELFAEYYDPAQSASRNISPEIEGEWQTAVMLYEQQEYEGALAAISVLLEDSTFAVKHGGEARLYQAICHLESKNYLAALSALEQIRVESMKYYPEREWYTALCYLGLNQKNSAISMLEQITKNEHHVYAKEARQLLNKLE